jgi:hypothetical protein
MDMQTEDFIQHVLQNGGRVFRRGDLSWFTPYPHRQWYLLSLPFWRALPAIPRDLDDLLSASGALVLRFPGQPGLKAGRLSHLLMAARPYGLEGMSRGVRTTTRKGLRNFSITPIALHDLARRGYAACADTERRRGIEGKGPDRFAQLCASMAVHTCWMAWAAQREGCIAAYLIALQMDDCYVIVEQRSMSEFLALKPNNALLYIFTHWALEEQKAEFVCHGMGAMERDPSQDSFKLSMGYERLPIRDVLVVRRPIKRWLKMVPPGIFACLRIAAAARKRESLMKGVALAELARCSP